MVQGIPVVVPGDSSIAVPVTGIFLRRMARRCMVNVSHLTGWCGRWGHWFSLMGTAKFRGFMGKLG
jgi:hypothetical protein